MSNYICNYIICLIYKIDYLFRAMSRQGDDSEHRRSADREGDSNSPRVDSTSGGG